MLVDSHKLYVEAVKDVVNREKDLMISYKLSSACDILQILKNENAEKPDVIIIDADLKEKEPVGLSHATYLTRQYPGIAVIVQSLQKIAIYPHKMEQAGVAGFLFKDCSNRELITAIRVVASGKSFYQREVQTVMKRYRDYLDSPADNVPFLTRTETSILQWMSWGLSDDRIAENMQMCQKIISLHWHNISLKFGTVNLWEILRESKSRGYFEPNPSI